MVGGLESMVIASIWDSMAAWYTPTVLFCLTNLIIATIFIASNNNNKNPTDLDHVHTNSYTPIAKISSFLDRAKSIDLSSFIPAIITTTTAAESQLELPSPPKPAKYTSLSRLAQSIFFICNYDSQPDCKRYPSNKPNASPSLLGRLKSIDFSSVYGDNKTVSTESKQVFDSGQLVSDQVNSSKICDSVQIVRNRVSSSKVSNSGQVVSDRVNSSKISVSDQLVRDQINSSKISSNVDHMIKCKLETKMSMVEIKKSRSEVRVVSDDEEDYDLRRPETARAKRNADDDAKAENFISRFRDNLKLQRLESLGRYNELLRRPR